MWKLSTSVYSHILHSKDQPKKNNIFFRKRIPLVVSKILIEIWNIPNEACHGSTYSENLVYTYKIQTNWPLLKKVPFNINKIQNSPLF